MCGNPGAFLFKTTRFGDRGELAGWLAGWPRRGAAGKTAAKRGGDKQRGERKVERSDKTGAL
jgi:hypothetical protein